MNVSMDSMVNQMKDVTTKKTNGCEVLGYDPMATEVQMSCDQMTTNCDTNFGSLLIPGYLLVKSSTDSSTYHLQQTVMQIDVESDHQMAISSSDVESTPKPNQLPNSSSQLTTDCHNMNATKDTFNEDIQNNDHKRDNCVVVERNEKSNTSESMSDLNGSDGSLKTNGKQLSSSRSLRIDCAVCGKQFKKSYLKEHMKIHDNHRPYKCLICGKTYRWRTLLRNHKKTHLTVNPFTCPVCSLRMSSKFSVQQHVLKVHENIDKKFECNECDKKYVTIHQLRAHKKFHSEDRTRQCEYCGKVYKHIQSLERHRRLHKGEENSLDIRLKCGTCGLVCHSKTHYTAHQRIHTGEKPFVCEICGKTYRQISQLNQHKIVHTDLRPFNCSICDRTFRCRSNLQLHLDHHKGEKRHTCSHCSQKFYSYPNMLKHIRRNHLGLKPFKCDFCQNKSFCEKQELLNHLRTHTGEKRPTPRRKRPPLPVPSMDKTSDLIESQVNCKQKSKDMPKNDKSDND